MPKDERPVKRTPTGGLVHVIHDPRICPCCYCVDCLRVRREMEAS